jgi:glycosyltransferase involved in cell wall biosynthesis
MGKVSIIIPCFNSEEFIGDTILSVVNQTHEKWECIIVDDGSTDSSLDLIEEYSRSNPKIKSFIRGSDLKGASVCRNEGANMADGDYLIFLDSDDQLSPNCLENRVKRFKENPDKDFLVFYCELFKEKPGDTKLLWNIRTKVPDLQRYIAHDLSWHTTSPIWKKQSFLNLGGFDEKATCMQDWELHLRALVGNFNYIYFDDKPDCYYRKNHGGDTISSQKASIPKLVGREYLIKKHYIILKGEKVFQGKLRLNFASYFIDLARLWFKAGENEKKEEVLRFLEKENLISSKEKSILDKVIRVESKKVGTFIQKIRWKIHLYRKKRVINQEYFPKSTQYMYTYNDYLKIK